MHVRRLYSDFVLEVWAYEAFRLFKDRMVGIDSINRFDNILMSVVRADWSSNIFDSLRGRLASWVCYVHVIHANFANDNNQEAYCCASSLVFLSAHVVEGSQYAVRVCVCSTDSYYVTWGARADLQLPPGAPLPPTGKPIGKLSSGDFETVVEKGLVQYSTYTVHNLYQHAIGSLKSWKS